MKRKTVLARAVHSALAAEFANPKKLSAALVVSILVAPSGFAQVAAPAAETPPQSTEQIVVTGTRTSTRVVSDSQTPVDVISGAELASTGQIQLQSALKMVVPSFSVSAPATAGALDFTS